MPSVVRFLAAMGLIAGCLSTACSSSDTSTSSQPDDSSNGDDDDSSEDDGKSSGVTTKPTTCKPAKTTEDDCTCLEDNGSWYDNGWCTPECGTDKLCPNGTVCDRKSSGSCLPSCESDDDCKDGPVVWDHCNVDHGYCTNE